MFGKSIGLGAAFLGLGFAMLFQQVSPAAIVSVSGAIQSVSPPASVEIHSLQSPTTGVVFQERAGYQLLADTRVSIPGAIGVYDEQSDMRPTDLVAGTVVNSYLLHFDTDFGAPNYQGTVQFRDPIVGVMLLPFALNSSDAELGAPGTLYPANAGSRRGLDFNDFNSLDTFTITDERTVSFDLVSSNVADQIRVVTSVTAVPEPGSAALLFGMVSVLAAVRLRRKKRTR